MYLMNENKALAWLGSSMTVDQFISARTRQPHPFGGDWRVYNAEKV
jgi:hypothetical protein